MKPLRPTMTLLLSVTMSISFIFSGGRSQQPAPKPKERTGGVQAPGKRQTPAPPAPSKEKKAPKDTKQPADEESATPKVENTPNLAELRQRAIDLGQQVGEEASGIDDRRSAAVRQSFRPWRPTCLCHTARNPPAIGSGGHSRLPPLITRRHWMTTGSSSTRKSGPRVGTSGSKSSS